MLHQIERLPDWLKIAILVICFGLAGNADAHAGAMSSTNHIYAK